MNAINYLKFDLRIIKGTIKYYILALLIVCIINMFKSGSAITGMSYLFFLLVIMATIPFSTQSNQKSKEMYYMFPSKVSSMVMGRFLYLIILNSIVWVIEAITMIGFYNMQSISIPEISIMCFVGIITTIICLCQYSIYYKFGMEKGKALSMIIYMIPAFAIFMLPSALKDRVILNSKVFNNILTFIVNNKMIISILMFIIIVIIGMTSYLISCSICKNKDI